MRRSSISGVEAEITEKPVLYAPDYTKQFIVQTARQRKGLELLRPNEVSKVKNIQYFTRVENLRTVKKQFSTTQNESAGIIYGIKKLRHYLDS